MKKVYGVHNASASRRHIASEIQFDSSSAKKSCKKNNTSVLRIELYFPKKGVLSDFYFVILNCNHLITNEYATTFQRVCVCVIYID